MGKQSLFITGKDNKPKYKPVPDKKWYAGIIHDFASKPYKNTEWGNWIQIIVKLHTDRLNKTPDGKWKPVKIDGVTGRTIRSNTYGMTISPRSKLGAVVADIFGCESSEELGDIYDDDYRFDIEKELKEKKVAVYIENSDGDDGTIYSNATKFKTYNSWKAEYIAKAEGFNDTDDDDDWGI
tara:strand:- start:1376 stop:1918 length:543 start_codon:yes stop_codon:yes gene_type:complete